MTSTAKRICALAMAVLMLAGVMPAFSRPVRAAETAGTVLFDWNCDKISDVGSASTPNSNYYIVDGSSWTNRLQYGVQSGQVKVGGTAAQKGYGTLSLNKHTMTTAAFKLDMVMNVETLMTASDSPMWSGFVIDFDLPGGKNIYISLRGFDGVKAGDTTATIGVSKSSRGSEGHTVEFDIPTDGQFHTWTFQYDGISMLRFSIDGEIVQDFADVSYTYEKATPGQLLIKNLHLRMADGSAPNLLYIDSIKLTEGTTLRYNELESVTVPSDATADNFKVAVSTKYVAETNPTLSVKVHPRGNEAAAVSASVAHTATEQVVSFPNPLPFSGVCTVTVYCTEAQTYQFNYYVYNSKTELSAGASAAPTRENQAYTFSDFTEVTLPEGSAWYKAQYIEANGTSVQPTASSPSAMFIPATAATHSFEVPVSLTGKFAVYVGYVEGTQYLTVNGKSVKLANSASASNTVKEAFATTVSLNGEPLVISNTLGKLAKITYVKLVSITDELYTLSTTPDTSHHLITDNDGFSTLTNAAKGDFNTLFNADFVNKNTLIDQRQFIWCTFSTSILNYNSQAWWNHVNARLTELGIKNELEHYLDHVDPDGTYPDFTYKMRVADQNAYNNILKLNPSEPTGVNNIEGALHAKLAAAAETADVADEFYVSLRMSHFSAPGGQFEFQSGSYYRLHQDWRRVSSYNADGTPVYQTQLSYMYDSYRQYLHDILMEMAAPTNVTGILLDFGRYYMIFGEECKDIAVRTEIMNGFIKDLHDDLEENYPGKKLTVRVLDPIYEKATSWGLDYQNWVKQGWVDRVYISCQSHETFFDFEEYIDFFENYPNVEFYLGVNATLTGHDTTKAEEAFMQAGGTIEGGTRVSETDVMLRVYDFYNAGADGVLMFNWSSSNDMFKNMNNATLMKQWYNFSYPAVLTPATPMRFRESDATVFVESVAANVDTLQMEASETAVVSAAVLPANASNKGLKWTSSNEMVATVAAKSGVVTVTAVDSGTALIYATSVDGEISDSIEVSVTVIPVEGITVDQSAVTVYAGSSVTVNAAILPADASRQGVVWTSNNDQVAIVSNGVITGLKAGTAEITATSVEGGLNGGLNAKVAVTVQHAPVESVTLDKNSVSLNVGETDTLTATVLPAYATNKTVVWSSSDSTVADVVDGVVTARKAGTATITAASAENPALKAEAAVTVKYIHVDGVTLPQEEYRLDPGETLTVSALVSPENATDKTVTWSSSDPTVVDVVNESIYAGAAAVTPEVKANTQPSSSTRYDVPFDWENAASYAGVAGNASANYRYDAGTDVLTLDVTYQYDKWIGDFAITDLAGNEITTHDFTHYGISNSTGTNPQGTVGGTLWRASNTPTITINISGVTEPQDLYIWVSSIGTSGYKQARLLIDLPEEMEKVDGYECIKGLKPGVAEITVTTKDGGLTDTAVVRVGSPVAGVELDKETVSLQAGETETLTATVLPADASDKTVLWTSSDDTVAAVQNGVVTALKTGTATITAKTREGGFTDTAVVTVGTSVTGVELDKETVSLQVGETETLTATLIPADATEKGIVWSTSDDTVASISYTHVYGGEAAGVTSDAVADYLTALPVSDTDWAAAAANTDYTLAAYSSMRNAPIVTYSYDEEARTLTLNLSLTGSGNSFSSNIHGYVDAAVKAGTAMPAGLVVTKADGTTVIPYSSHNLMNNGDKLKPFGTSYVETLTLTFDNVTAVEDMIVWICGAGSSTERTMKVSVDFGDSMTVVETRPVIKALKPGTATITATTVDGGHTASAVVTVASAGYTVSGTAVAWNGTDNAVYLLYAGDTADSAIVNEWKSGTYATAGNVLATGVKGTISDVTVNNKTMKSQTFTFEGLADGKYKLAILKPGKYVPAIVEITVAGAAVDVGQQKLWLYGDVNSDGITNVTDATQILRYIVSNTSAFDNGDAVEKAQRRLAADVNGDGIANVTDATQILRYIVSNTSAFDSMR